MKRCFKCGECKPIGAFYRHKMMADGHLNKCKECTKLDVSKHRIENILRIRQYDKMRASLPHRVAARKLYAGTDDGRAAHQAALKTSRLRFPEKANARQITSNAIRDGRLQRWPVCEVPECSGKPEAHHVHYSAPMLVTWLCNKHHREVHAMGKETI